MNLPAFMPDAPLLHIAFYKFVELVDADAVATTLRELTRLLSGNILVAEEGINGVLAGPAWALDRFQQALLNDPRFAGRFAGIVFKRSACITPPFARMKVHRKPEIVALGVGDLQGTQAVGRITRPDNHLGPQAWRELIRRDDVVVIDNRNSFEFRLGRFKQAIDPQIAHFRDFPRYVAAQAPIWKAQGKRIAMYCTGGIRCEKTSAWMQDQGLDVVQLEGGILNFFQALPDAEQDWDGECFVFDNRIALDTRLHETHTSLEDVYRNEPDGDWRLQRARRLYAAVADAQPADPPRPATPRPRRPSPLPTRDGVSPSCIALPDGPWPTLLDFLAERFPAVSRSAWAERMAAGEVVHDDGLPLPVDAAYAPLRKLHYYRQLSAEQAVPFEEAVVYQDEWIVVADKPHFLPVVPTGRYVQETLLVRLKRKLGIATLAPAHRIDRETAGLVLFTVQPATRDSYQAMFRNRRVSKTYEAVAPLHADLELPLVRRSRLEESASFMQMHEVPGEPNAQTTIELIRAIHPPLNDKGKPLGHYRLTPLTGQRHQLRVHLAALGLPIVNDQIYPVLQAEQPVADYSHPLQLLARTLAFVDPLTGESRQFASRRELDFASSRTS